MVSFGAAGIALLMNLIFFSKKTLIYEVIAAAIHLMAFIFIKEFTLETVMYLVFAVVPFILRQWRVKGWCLLALFFISFQLIHGMMRNFYPASSSFFVMYYAIIVIGICNMSTNRIINEYNLLGILRLISFVEVIISALLYLTNRSTGHSWLVVNHQPVGANLSIVGILLVLLIMLGNVQNLKRRALPHMILYVFLALWSSIRGYQIIVFPLAAFSVYSFFASRHSKTIALVAAGLVVLSLAILVVSASLLGFVITDYFDTNVGYRGAENRFVLDAMIHSNIVFLLLGYGVFSTGLVIGNTEIIWKAARGSIYIASHLMYDGRYLNVWLDALKDFGVIGMLFVVCIYFQIIKQYRDNPLPISQKRALILYFALYGVMMAFRNSCTCAMLELGVLRYLFATFRPCQIEKA